MNLVAEKNSFYCNFAWCTICTITEKPPAQKLVIEKREFCRNWHFFRQVHFYAQAIFVQFEGQWEKQLVSYLHFTDLSQGPGRTLMRAGFGLRVVCSIRTCPAPSSAPTPRNTVYNHASMSQSSILELSTFMNLPNLLCAINALDTVLVQTHLDIEFITQSVFTW